MKRPAACEGLRIGVGGVPLSARPRVSEVGVRRCRELGLSCMELEFVNGVRMGEETAEKVAQASKASDVALTVHGPYFINLNSREPEKKAASIERLFETARIGALCGAGSFTFHAAFNHDDAPAVVHKAVVKGMRELQKRVQGAGIPIDIRPELTGKPNQYGSLEELMHLCQDVPGIYPCIDFSHHHARGGGGQNGYESFSRTLETIRKALGPDALKRLHMHVSGIEYGPKGERRHLPLLDADFLYEELMQALVDFEVNGWLVCESPVLEQDGLLLLEARKRCAKAEAR